MLCECSNLDWRDVDQTQPHHPKCSKFLAQDTGLGSIAGAAIVLFQPDSAAVKQAVWVETSKVDSEVFLRTTDGVSWSQTVIRAWGNANEPLTAHEIAYIAQGYAACS